MVSQQLLKTVKLVHVVTVADVDDEDRVGNSLLQIWELILKICISDWNLTEHIGLSNEGNN